MAKNSAEWRPPLRKPLVWLHGEVKTPPFFQPARRESGFLLGLLQAGEQLGMPQSEPLPIVGARCHALRIRDDRHSWRIVYRADDDAIVVVEVYAKKTRKIPDQIINVCKRRLRAYEEV